jgi:integrase
MVEIQSANQFEGEPMPGKQAKLLTGIDISRALRHLGRGRYPDRDRVMVLLSVKAGLRAGEIAGLTWAMVCGADGQVGQVIELRDAAAKMGSGRTIPLHPKLRAALIKLRQGASGDGAVIVSERGGPLAPNSVVNWFAALYRDLGLVGCSSHSGRRTFVIRAARLVFKAGGSLRDVQQLAGHPSIDQTQAYIEGDTRAKRRLVALL